MHAGFGKVEITPRVGVELCGFGPYLNRHSTRVVEPLYARAMAVELGDARWVLISCDLLGVSAQLTQQIRARVGQATHLRDEQIMVHTTHTHSGPCTTPELIGWGDPDDPYLEILPRLIASAGIHAVRDLAPATLYHAVVPAAGFSYNREFPDPGRTNELAMDWQWQTDRPTETDTSAHVIRLDSGGQCAGFLTYFSCHPVVCCERNTEIHGDFVGSATNRMEKEFPGAVGLFLQGAHGDLNSNYVHGMPAQSLVALERFSARFASVIRAGLQQAQPVTVTKIASVLGDEPYSHEKFAEPALRDQLAGYEATLATADPRLEDRDSRMAMVYAKGLRKILTDGNRQSPLPVHSFRLGPLTLTGMPLEIMHRIKRNFQAELGDRALLLSCTNDFLGYAPLREYYQASTFRYAVRMVPLMVGRRPFTANFEDEVLAAALTVTRKI